MTAEDAADEQSDWGAQYRAVRESVGLLDRVSRARLAVTGGDRFSWLQGMVTNDVRLLSGARNAIQACVLNSTGHVLADLTIVVLGESLLLDMVGSLGGKMLALLDEFIITEDVALADRSLQVSCLSLQGPAADRRLLQGFAPDSAVIVPMDHTGEGGFDLYLDREFVAPVRASLAHAGIPSVGPEAAEVLRVEAGIPRYGVDMDESTILLEAGLGPTHLSESKGCYIGQEIIARIQSRGHTNRTLVGFVSSSPHPLRYREQIFAGDEAARSVGWITSSIQSPAIGRTIALGYVRHESAAPGARLQTAGGTELTVSSLPFVARVE